MQSTSVTDHEFRRLASVASGYENRGYQVKLQPAAGDIRLSLETVNQWL